MNHKRITISDESGLGECRQQGYLETKIPRTISGRKAVAMG